MTFRKWKVISWLVHVGGSILLGSSAIALLITAMIVGTAGHHLKAFFPWLAAFGCLVLQYLHGKWAVRWTHWLFEAKVEPYYTAKNERPTK
jgi:hypothetical protein